MGFDYKIQIPLVPAENEFGFLVESKSHEGALALANNQSRLYAFSLQDGESDKVAIQSVSSLIIMRGCRLEIYLRNRFSLGIRPFSFKDLYALRTEKMALRQNWLFNSVSQRDIL